MSQIIDNTGGRWLHLDGCEFTLTSWFTWVERTTGLHFWRTPINVNATEPHAQTNIHALAYVAGHVPGVAR